MQSDFDLAVPQDSVPSMAGLNKFGRNPSVQSAAAEDVWDAGGTWVAPTAARIHALVSDDGDDDYGAKANGTITFGAPVVDDTVTVNSNTFIYASGASTSASPSDSPSPSPSASASPSSSASLSVSPSASASSSTSVSSSASASPSASASGSSSSSPSPSASASISPSASESPSASVSPSASASLSLSPSASASPSSSASLSVSPSSSSSLSLSPSASSSPSASVSPSASTSPAAEEFTNIDNLTALIDALADISASNDGTTITIVADDVGTAGNSNTLGLSGDNTGTMEISGNAFTGGEAEGTGAQTIEIQGLDAQYKEIIETINLRGVTSVNTVNSFTMINRMIIRAAGSGGVNAGDITATAADDATVTAQITGGNNQTLMAIYMVPAEKVLFLRDYYATINNAGGAAGDCDIYMYIKPFGEVFQVKSIMGLTDGSTTHADQKFSPNMRVEPKSIIKMNALVTANDENISAGFDGVLESLT